jgi:type III restriction enzyme
VVEPVENTGALDGAGTPFDLDRIAAIASSLDLREPNREAVESIAFEVAQHFEIDKKKPPFECVVDSATGVGKSYVMAGTIEFFAAQGVRNFAIVVPGNTILKKTERNYTRGDSKSLMEGMEVEPTVITSENFNSAGMRRAMDDPSKVKLYVFTVQSLLKPQTTAGRKTRKFQEGLGQAFYERLQDARDLIVLADEHHVYYGPRFSDAVRGLKPRVLIGLTATPHPQTPEEQIIYRYPLAAAIADELVKTPVIVGRKDDRSDVRTKLTDGISLLELKAEAIKTYCRDTGQEPVNPMMMVVAPDIAAAEEIQELVKDKSFARGRYGDRVLTVHTKVADDALKELEKLEEPDSPYRIIVSVGMLKEGWDVKTVYCICSLRASVSDLLTEQTMGRGLRLPFGKYSGVPLLDQLEILAHERYEALLKKAKALNEDFIDKRTRAVLRRDSTGQLVSQVETTEVETPVTTEEGEVPAGAAGVSSVESEAEKGKKGVEAMAQELKPRSDATLEIPRLKMTPVQSKFSLADITDLDPFRKLGERLATNPGEELRRMQVSARIVTGEDGIRRTTLVTAPAVDKVTSPPTLIPLEDLREQLFEQVLSAPAVPARASERGRAAPLIQAFFDGLGDQAEELLSGYLDRAAAGLINLVSQEQKKLAVKPTYEEVVELITFKPMRYGRPDVSTDKISKFKRGVAYEYAKSLYEQDWFDSSTERAVANAIDDEGEIDFWVRLQTGDLPILWASGREYNPDFVVVEKEGEHFVVETKADRDMGSNVVQGKREAARRWANYVSADSKVKAKWSYLLLSETDVKTAKDSWAALKRLAS